MFNPSAEGIVYTYMPVRKSARVESVATTDTTSLDSRAIVMYIDCYIMTYIDCCRDSDVHNKEVPN